MKFTFKKINWILLAIALAVTFAGYFVMGTGDKTISTILLVIAYLVLFPVSIMAGTKNKDQ